MDEILHRLPASYFRFDDNGVILEANRTLEKLLDHPAGAFNGRRIDEIMAPGGRIYYQTHLFPSLKLQGELREIYLKLLSANGSIVPVLANISRQPREDGRFENQCVAMRMSERDRYETEILRAKRAAEAADDAKAKFVSLMSHELRTPLQSILGYADLLSSDPNGSLRDEQLADIAAIKSAGSSLANLLDDILNFAQLGSTGANLKLSRVSVLEAIHRAETLVRLRIQESGLSYCCAPIPEELSVRADDYRLQQILLNLLVNALKFTKPGGRISIGCRAADGLVSIDVTDSGVGIPEENLTKIFEPFVQLDRSLHKGASDGVGLGLPISRNLARAMSGDVTVSSEKDKGSTFTITLPIAAD
jgi:signal transduction histidine kinase